MSEIVCVFKLLLRECFVCFSNQVYQSWLDKSTPFYVVRWALTLLLTAVYMIRVYILQVFPVPFYFQCLLSNMLAVFVFFQLVESFLFCFSSLLSTCSVSFTMRTCFCAAFQGWYIVTYALGIYHLNLFIAFLSPKVDPSLLEEGKLAKLHWASGYVLCYLKFFLQRVNADGLCPVFTCR